MKTDKIAIKKLFSSGLALLVVAAALVMMSPAAEAYPTCETNAECFPYACVQGSNGKFCTTPCKMHSACEGLEEQTNATYCCEPAPSSVDDTDMICVPSGASSSC